MYCCSRKRNDSGRVEHTRQRPIGSWQTHFLAEYRVSSAGTFNRHQRKITSLLSAQIESLRSCFIFAILLNPLYSFNTICMILQQTNKFFGASQILRISNGYECFIYIFREALNMRRVKICNKKTKKKSTLIYCSVRSSVTYGVNLGSLGKGLSPHTSGFVCCG